MKKLTLVFSVFFVIGLFSTTSHAWWGEWFEKVAEKFTNSSSFENEVEVPDGELTQSEFNKSLLYSNQKVGLNIQRTEIINPTSAKLINKLEEAAKASDNLSLYQCTTKGELVTCGAKTSAQYQVQRDVVRRCAGAIFVISEDGESGESHRKGYTSQRTCEGQEKVLCAAQAMCITEIKLDKKDINNIPHQTQPSDESSARQTAE